MTDTADRARYEAAKAYYNLRWNDGAFGVIGEQHAAPYYEVVDAILAALTAANLAIVDAGELAALREFVAAFDAFQDVGLYAGILSDDDSVRVPKAERWQALKDAQFAARKALGPYMQQGGDVR